MQQNRMKRNCLCVDSLIVACRVLTVTTAGVVLQTFPLADLPPEGLQHCKPSPRKICNIADLPPEDLQHCRPSLKGTVCNIADLPPFIADLPLGKICNIADLPHFCKVPDSNFRIYRNKGF